MVNRMAIRNVIGIIGNIISFGLFLSPLQTFYKIYKKGDVEEFSPNPYLATVLNCLLWVFYGLPFVHPHSILVVTINGVGLAIELGYVFLYLAYANKKQRMKVSMVLAAEFVFFVIVVTCTLLLVHGSRERSLIVGIFCDVFNILMYGMPLDVMMLVIRTKSVEYMPFLLLVANFLNGICWLTFGLLRFDIFLVISNGSGAALGLLQLILYAYYYKSTPKSGTDNKAANGIQLTSTSGNGAISAVDYLKYMMGILGAEVVDFI